MMYLTEIWKVVKYRIVSDIHVNGYKSYDSTNL